MEGLWIIIAIVVLVYRVLNKAGEISGEIKGRLPGGLGEKGYPPVIKDWGLPWDDEIEADADGGWDERTEPQDKVLKEKTMETVVDAQSNLQQEQEASGIDRHPLIDSASLINGLILSELLQPPKSKRFGRRF